MVSSFLEVPLLLLLFPFTILSLSLSCTILVFIWSTSSHCSRLALKKKKTKKKGEKNSLPLGLLCSSPSFSFSVRSGMLAQPPGVGGGPHIPPQQKCCSRGGAGPRQWGLSAFAQHTHSTVMDTHAYAQLIAVEPPSSITPRPPAPYPFLGSQLQLQQSHNNKKSNSGRKQTHTCTNHITFICPFF